jgi:hypothetical protein
MPATRRLEMSVIDAICDIEDAVKSADLMAIEIVEDYLYKGPEVRCAKGDTDTAKQKMAILMDYLEKCRENVGRIQKEKASGS